MITVKPLAEAQVLVVGAGDLVNEILRLFVSYGVHNVTVMDASMAADEKLCKFIKRDPLECIESDEDYFTSFDIVLAANQPRSFELALSDLRWPKNGENKDPDLPMIVMRSVSNICKMRCQYRELPVNGSEPSKFVSLPMDLLPWTDEKRTSIASMIRNEFKPEHDQTFQSYLIAALAYVNLNELTGAWPGAEDQKQVQEMAEKLGKGTESNAQPFVAQLCKGGLAEAHETIAILARLVVLDALKLLTGNGHPINNTSLEEVIQITMAGTW